MLKDVNAISHIVVDLLSDKSSELGARLKQRLNAALLNKGLGRFDEKAFGYNKFRDFLEKALAEVVSVEDSNTTRDILVTLRLSAVPSTQAFSHEEDRPPTPVVRSDVWQAFSNPDPKRKRYFHKSAVKLVHFLITSDQNQQQLIESTPQDFAEINPIEGSIQLTWMKNFLRDSPLSQTEKSRMAMLLNEPYSSNLNSFFTRALGEVGVGWRNYRTRLIHEKIVEWARSFDISMSVLYSQLRTISDVAPVPELNESITPRQQATKMLELLSDDDISRVVLPILVSTMLIRARL